MSRIIGVDFGERRVGIAVSDPTGLIARTAGIFERRSDHQAAEHLARLAREWEAEEVVIGLPLNADGSEGFQARRVRRFASVLQALLGGCPVILWDESLSSIEARDLLAERGKRSRRRHHDDVAAAVILQSYLDVRRRQNAEGASSAL
ncbi:MAG: Holliday junction resolvase RuvX [Anaerolineae bacterium]